MTKFGGEKIEFRVNKIVPQEESEYGYVLIDIIQNFNAYCNYDGRIKEQKTVDYQGNWAKCQNNYECESNACSSGECIEIANMIRDAKGFKSVFVKVVCRVANLFNVENYEECVVNNLGQEFLDNDNSVEEPSSGGGGGGGSGSSSSSS